MTLGELIQGLEGAELVGDAGTEIKQVEYDSRLISSDALFFAIKGYQRDGHEFLEQAKANGAVAALGEKAGAVPIANYVRVPDARQAMAEVSARFYGFPGEKIKVCGVTGTNGKTTTCFMIRSILEARNKKTGLVTSRLYDTGGDTFTAERTTPESLDMQRLLYLMKKNHCVNAVVEVSSHALMLHRVDHVNFRVAVYTNLTRDHLDFHGSMEEYLNAKALLLRKLKDPLSYAVINLDVPEFRSLFGETDRTAISYSLANSQADVYCREYEFDVQGTTFDLVTPMGIRTVRMQLPGRFNLMNALAAAAGGLASGVDLDNVVQGLESCAPVQGRLHPIDLGQPFAVYVDYAHTPDALFRLCETVREMTDGRVLLMFGCGGDRDKGKRPLMGSAAVSGADQVVITSDNPRSEDPQAIVEDIKPGLTKNNYTIHLDRREAIAAILKMAREGDVVLLAGKGAETYQEVRGERIPFSDIKQTRTVLVSLGYHIETELEGN